MVLLPAVYPSQVLWWCLSHLRSYLGILLGFLICSLLSVLLPDLREDLPLQHSCYRYWELSPLTFVGRILGRWREWSCFWFHGHIGDWKCPGTHWNVNDKICSHWHTVSLMYTVVKVHNIATLLEVSIAFGNWIRTYNLFPWENESNWCINLKNISGKNIFIKFTHNWEHSPPFLFQDYIQCSVVYLSLPSVET